MQTRVNELFYLFVAEKKKIYLARKKKKSYQEHMQRVAQFSLKSLAATAISLMKLPIYNEKDKIAIKKKKSFI